MKNIYFVKFSLNQNYIYKKNILKLYLLITKIDTPK